MDLRLGMLWDPIEALGRPAPSDPAPCHGAPKRRTTSASAASSQPPPRIGCRDGSEHLVGRLHELRVVNLNPLRLRNVHVMHGVAPE